MHRIEKENYYLDIAQTVFKRGTCLKKNFGAVIVNNNQIISSGYTGAPHLRKNCIDIGKYIRQSLEISKGAHYELCRSVHAEANSMIYASRQDITRGTLYLVGEEVSTQE